MNDLQKTIHDIEEQIEFFKSIKDGQGYQDDQDNQDNQDNQNELIVRLENLKHTLLNTYCEQEDNPVEKFIVDEIDNVNMNVDNYDIVEKKKENETKITDIFADFIKSGDKIEEFVKKEKHAITSGVVTGVTSGVIIFGGCSLMIGLVPGLLPGVVAGAGGLVAGYVGMKIKDKLNNKDKSKN